MSQLVGRHSGQNRHDLHAGVHSSLYARTCILEWQARPGRLPACRRTISNTRHSSGGTSKDLIGRHNNLRKWQTCCCDARLRECPPSRSHDRPRMIPERTHNLHCSRYSHNTFQLCLLITIHLVQFLSMVTPGQKPLHRRDRWTSVGEREYGLERNGMPLCPPVPGAFNHTSRIDQRAIHIEQNCSASQGQRIERSSPEKPIFCRLSPKT